jgi:hypothetical protein
LTQEILWIHAELFGPYGITFFRNATAPRLYLRYERIIVDADSYGEGALRVTRVLAQLLEPLPAFLSKLLNLHVIAALADRCSHGFIILRRMGSRTIRLISPVVATVS